MEKYFFEAFEGMERLGPGSEQSTQRAAKYIDSQKPTRILDIGCGVGTHTFLLAKALPNAEGAIYIAGFTNGLESWKHFLKSNGMIICSEISWLTDTPSVEPK